MFNIKPSSDADYVLEIVFDIEKVLSDDKYSFEAVYNASLKPYTDRDLGYFMTNDNRLVIYAKYTEDSASMILYTTMKLYECHWFRDYVCNILFYDFNDLDETGNVEPENVLDSFKIREWS